MNQNLDQQTWPSDIGTSEITTNCWKQVTVVGFTGPQLEVWTSRGKSVLMRGQRFIDFAIYLLAQATGEMGEPTSRIRLLEAENNRLVVQLAGCSVAALEDTKEPATEDMWGWSPAYRDVLKLRLEYERLRVQLAEAHKDTERLNTYEKLAPQKRFQVLWETTWDWYFDQVKYGPLRDAIDAAREKENVLKEKTNELSKNE